MAEADNILLVVYTPEKTVLEKMVAKVTLPATKGPFMVLKNHAPLISSLEEGRIVFVSGGVPGNIEIRSGFVEIVDNKVTVCAEL